MKSLRCDITYLPLRKALVTQYRSFSKVQEKAGPRVTLWTQSVGEEGSCSVHLADLWLTASERRSGYGEEETGTRDDRKRLYEATSAIPMETSPGSSRFSRPLSLLFPSFLGLWFCPSALPKVFLSCHLWSSSHHPYCPFKVSQRGRKEGGKEVLLLGALPTLHPTPISFHDSCKLLLWEEEKGREEKRVSTLFSCFPNSISDVGVLTQPGPHNLRH